MSSPPARVAGRVVAAVSLGGALGAVLRAVLTALVPDSTSGFPWTTFGVNVLGAGALAALPALAAARRSPVWSGLLGTGLLGGFTTLSTTSEQARSLVASQAPGSSVTAAAYVVGTLLASLLAVHVMSTVVGAVRERDLEREEGDL